MVSEASRNRTAAERLFHEYLERRRAEGAVDLAAFLAGRPEPLAAEVHREVCSIAEDYELLRGELAEDAAGIAPGRIVDDYRLLRRIGSGGAGTVWEAMQVSLGRRVALKILHPHLTLSERTVERFHREAETAGRLSHPAIVTVFAMGRSDGLHFIAEELVEDGTTYAERLAQLRELSELPHDYYRATARLFAELADGLEIAHAQGVVHRDVKPGNVLLTRDGRPKIADFGLAKLADQLSLSRTGELTGTPFYLSPEQAMGSRALDARSDVFSLGVTLYEALTLQRPFQGDTSHQVLRKIVAEEPIDPRRLRSRVPRELALICRRAIEKSPGRRYSSMASFAADLRHWLNDEPIVARAPRPHERAWKWARRHRVWAVGLGLGFVAFLVVGALLVRIQGLQSATQRTLGAFLEVTDPRNLRKWGESDAEYVRTKIVEPAHKIFAGDPASLAYAMRIAGIAYMVLGQYSAAIDSFEEAARGYAAESGPQAAVTLDTRLDHVAALLALYREEEAVRVLEETLEVFDDDPSSTDPRLADALANLFGIHERAMRRPELLELEDRYGPIRKRLQSSIAALDGRTAASGGIAEEQVKYRLQTHVAQFLMYDRRYDQAQEVIAKVCAGLEDLCGAEHLWTLDARELELAILTHHGRYPDCLRRGEELQRRVARLVGRLHPMTARIEGMLGEIRRDAGDWEAALDHHEQALDGLARILSASHPAYLVHRTSYGITLGRAGHLPEAEQVLRDTMQRLLDAELADRRAMLICQRALAEVFEWAGRAPEAQELLEARAAAGAPDANATLALFLWRQGEIARARDLLAADISRREESGSRTLLGEHLNLAGVLLDLGSLDDAESQIQYVVKRLPDMPNPRRLEEIALRIACLRSDLALARGDPDAALAVAGPVDPPSFATFSPAGREVLEAVRLVPVARAHAARGEVDRAREEALRARAALETTPWFARERQNAEALLAALAK
ncbi:MAG: serine/threonine-protein kinase [Planctomycetota bacterium]